MTELFRAANGILFAFIYFYCIFLYFSRTLKLSVKVLGFSLLLSAILTLLLNFESLNSRKIEPSLWIILFTVTFLKIHFSIEINSNFLRKIPKYKLGSNNWIFIGFLTVIYAYIGSIYSSRAAGYVNYIDLIILTPIIEEIAFRLGLLGFINGFLKLKKDNYIISSILTSFLFTFIHYPTQGRIESLLFSIFPLSILLCQVRVQSIYLSILVHSMFNLFSILFLQL